MAMQLHSDLSQIEGNEGVLALVLYKRELSRWKRENRRNVELYRRRVESYKRKLTHFNVTSAEILRKYAESYAVINSRYSKLIAGAKSVKDEHNLDLERRVKIADAIIARDKAIAALGEPPTYPEFFITEGKPVPPLQF